MSCVKLKPLIKVFRFQKWQNFRSGFGTFRLSSPRPTDKVEKVCQDIHENRHCMINDVCNMSPITQYV